VLLLRDNPTHCPVGETPQEIVIQDKDEVNQAMHRIAKTLK
jgi:hypothetical protein